MHLSKFPFVLRLISCLALLQVFAPALVAIADAWTGDTRPAIAHIESESGSSCVVVHHDECALCAFIGGAAPAVSSSDSWVFVAGDTARSNAQWNALPGSTRAGPGQRAPPVS